MRVLWQHCRSVYLCSSLDQTPSIVCWWTHQGSPPQSCTEVSCNAWFSLHTIQCKLPLHIANGTVYAQWQLPTYTAMHKAQCTRDSAYRDCSVLSTHLNRCVILRLLKTIAPPSAMAPYRPKRVKTEIIAHHIPLITLHLSLFTYHISLITLNK